MMEMTVFGRKVKKNSTTSHGSQPFDPVFQQLADHFHQGIWLVDADFNIIYTNPCLCAMLHYSPLELAGQSVAEFIFKARSDSSVLNLPDQLVVGTTTESVLIGKNGDRFEVVFEISALSFGKQDGFCIVVNEILFNQLGEAAYRLLIENPLQGFVIVQTGRLVFANPAFAAMLGYSTDELISLKPAELLSLIHPEDRCQDTFEEVVLFGCSLADPAKHIRLLSDDGETWWMNCAAVEVTYNKAPAAMITFTKVERRHEAQNALHESEYRFHILMENAPVGIAVLSQGTVVYANSAFLRLFGIADTDDIVGKAALDQVQVWCKNHIFRMLDNRLCREWRDVDNEIEAVRVDGSSFSCRMIMTRIKLQEGMATLAFFLDLSAQKISEKKLDASRIELRNLANSLQCAREDERRMVAREIHDELGQSLTALKMDIQWLQKKMTPQSDAISRKIRDSVHMADQAIRMVHRIASELRPGVLDDLGLAAAIEWLGGDFTRRNSVPCRVDIGSLELKIGGRSTTALFRIIQESLNNVALHAHAVHAWVELWEENGELNIRVQDDGIGIKESQLLSPLSIGLIGIRERVQNMHGVVTILGRPGRGTIVSVTIPLSAEGALA